MIYKGERISKRDLEQVDRNHEKFAEKNRDSEAWKVGRAAIIEFLQNHQEEFDMVDLINYVYERNKEAGVFYYVGAILHDLAKEAQATGMIKA